MSILIVISLLIGSSGIAMADTNLTDFAPNITNIFNDAIDSPQDWGDSGLTRALLAILLLTDVQSEYEDAIDDFTEALQDADVYVGRTGRGIESCYTITYRSSEKVLMIGYVPLTGDAQFGVSDWVTKSVIEKVGEETYDRFWELELGDIADAVDALSTLLDNS